MGVADKEFEQPLRDLSAEDLEAGLQEVQQTQVGFAGKLYIVKGSRIEGQGGNFWIERADLPDLVWQHISEPPPVSGLADPDEFVAATEGGLNDLVEQIAMRTGWFARTGRMVEHPRTRFNAVWRIAPDCPLASPDVCRSPSSEAMTGVQAVMTALAERLEPVGIMAVAVTLLDSVLGQSPRRKLMAAHPLSLYGQVRRFDQLPPDDEDGKWADCGRIDKKSAPWTAGLQDLGYGSWVRLRLPAAADGYFEILMLSPEKLVDEQRVATATWIACNSAAELRRVVARAHVRLTSRERECLTGAISGMTAEETAQVVDCSPRTVRFHLTNASAKLGANNVVHAVSRGHALGVWFKES